MSRWRRPLRAGLALVALVTIAAVAWTARGRRPRPAPAPVTRADPTAIAEATVGRLTQTSGTRVPGQVDYERMLAYADGSMKLVGPRVSSSRGGREFRVDAREALVNADQSNVVMTGDVVLTNGDGLTVSSTEASYNRGEGVVRAPGRVRFSKTDGLSGSAVGLTYDQTRDVVWLLDQVVMRFAAAPGGDPGADVTAGTAGLARRDRYLRFERGVRMRRADRTIDADAALAFLTDDERRLKALELRGRSRITMAAPAEGALQAMEARDMNLTFAPDGETLERALLVGTARIQLSGADGRAGRRIAAEIVDAAFAPGGGLVGLTGRDRVETSFPGGGSQPERTIRAATLDASGRAGGGLTAFRFAGDVEFRERTTAGGTRIARAATLDAAVEPTSGAIDDATFQGGTRFEDGALRAVAATARYAIAKGDLELTGAHAGTGPRVQDEDITITARQIRLAVDSRRLAATGEVQSVMQPRRTTGAKDDRTVPGLLEDDKPAYVTGAALDYDGGARRATYRGGSRLWQGDTAIQAESIAIDEASGDLTATTAVRTTFPLEQTDAKEKTTKRVQTIATAARMHYDDGARRATYETDARATGPQGDLKGDTIIMFLAAGGGSLERLEASGHVTLAADRRTAAGDHLTYFAADERYVMRGSPVRILELDACRETTGKTLTFDRATDRILVDGNEEIRTLTKSGGTCTEPRQK